MSEEVKTPGTSTPNEPNPGKPNEPAGGQPQGKTWTDEYVQSLRGEAKDNRLKAKSLEKMLRGLIGLTDDDDLDDSKIEGYKAQRQKELDEATSKANARLLKAAVKSLEGYDAKLLDRLMDKSKVEYDDDGEPTNLAKLAEELATEFPQVKVGAAEPPKGGAPANPPGAGGTKTPIQEYEELKDLVRKNPYDSSLKLKLMKARERLIK